MNTYYFTFRVNGTDRFGREIKPSIGVHIWDFTGKDQEEAQQKLRACFVPTINVDIVEVTSLPWDVTIPKLYSTIA